MQPTLLGRLRALLTRKASISEAPAARPEVMTIARLSPEVYRKFVESLPQAVIDKNATDAGCDAAYKLGIQYVLARLRDQIVIE